MIAVGGFLAFFWWVLYILMPLIALIFLFKFANILHRKSTKTYREELNDLTMKSITQLQKIKKLNPQFLNSDVLLKLDGHLMHGYKDRYGYELFKNELNYTNEHLQSVLDDIIRFIKLIQRLAIQAK